MKLDKKGQNLVANVFIVIFTLIIFFSLWGGVDALLDVSKTTVQNETNSTTLDFMMDAIPFVILLGVLIWVYNTTISGSRE